MGPVWYEATEKLHLVPFGETFDDSIVEWVLLQSFLNEATI
ncbi:hypothetical protein SZ39_2732 [Bacillus mycoides]|nr:hypothetical protein SZ39_2732 [Bacillus mycoides]